MSLPSFQTNTLKSRRKAVIDGHEYVVRRMGNIERLEALRRQDEVNSLLKKYPENVDDKEITKKDMQRIDELAMASASALVALFDDGGDQSKSHDLVKSLDDTEIIDIIESVFDQTEERDNEKA